MSYFQLISLFLIFGLINSSIEYKLKTRNHLRRSTRDVDSEGEGGQPTFGNLFDDEDRFHRELKENIRTDEDLIHTVVRNILTATNRIMEASSTDGDTATQWANIQNYLRNGLTVIIKAYRRYIDVHKQSCGSIENFANNMVRKYNNELSVVNQLSVPNFGDGNTNNSQTNDWITDMLPFFVTYAKIHQSTLAIAADAAGDLTARTGEHRADILGQNTNVMRFTIPRSNNLADEPHTLNLPCNPPRGFNGGRACAGRLADETNQWAKKTLQVATSQTVTDETLELPAETVTDAPPNELLYQ